MLIEHLIGQRPVCGIRLPRRNAATSPWKLKLWICLIKQKGFRSVGVETSQLASANQLQN
jgi:hypothetical protein